MNLIEYLNRQIPWSERAVLRAIAGIERTTAGMQRAYAQGGDQEAGDSKGGVT